MPRLTALRVYEHLPRANCRKCGEESCMAFAIKLLGREQRPEACELLTAEQLETLKELLKPPVREVRIGKPPFELTIGGEEVMFRHELKFFNPTALFLEASDTLGEDELLRRVEFLKSFELERVGKRLRLQGIAIRNKSADPKTFRKAVEVVAQAYEGPLMLCSFRPEAHEACEDLIAERRPLLYAATSKNWWEMLQLALRCDAPLALHAASLEELVSLAATIALMGFEQLVLDLGLDPKELRSAFLRFIELRKAALRGHEGAGFPLMVSLASKGVDARSLFYESLLASMLVHRYASLLVVRSREVWSLMPLLVLRDNIYTDPRTRPSVKPGVYEINQPDRSSPVLVTGNSTLTYYLVTGDLEKDGVSCYLVVVDTEGLAVAAAVTTEKFGADAIKRVLESSDLEQRVEHKVFIIPGVAVRLKGSVEEATGWDVLVGPQDSSEIASFLKEKWRGKWKT